jgi:hypothetical protein
LASPRYSFRSNDQELLRTVSQITLTRKVPRGVVFFD